MIEIPTRKTLVLYEGLSSERAIFGMSSEEVLAYGPYAHHVRYGLGSFWLSYDGQSPVFHPVEPEFAHYEQRQLEVLDVIRRHRIEIGRVNLDMRVVVTTQLSTSELNSLTILKRRIQQKWPSLEVVLSVGSNCYADGRLGILAAHGPTSAERPVLDLSELEYLIEAEEVAQALQESEAIPAVMRLGGRHEVIVLTDDPALVSGSPDAA